MSYLEDRFENWLTQNGIEFVKEFKPVLSRRYRCDFYLEKYNLIIEIEGGTFSPKARHQHGMGFVKDCDKYNLLSSLGYKIFRFTTQHVNENNYDVLIEFIKLNKIN